MAFVTKRTAASGPRWLVHYRGADGRQRSETWATKADAERRRAELAHLLIRGEWVDPARAAQPLSAWAREWLDAQTHLRPTTLAQRRAVIEHHLGDLGAMPLSAITADDVRRWLRAQQGRSVADRLARLRQILQAAVDDGRLRANPAAKVRAPAPQRVDRRFLGVDQLDDLVAAVPERWQAMVAVAGWCGLRWGELTGLRRRHVDMQRGRLHIVEQLARTGNGALERRAPKTAGSRRAVTMPASVSAMLTAHMDRHCPADPDALVFSGPDGAPVDGSHWRQRVWAPATASVGLSGMRIHDLRHTAASLAIASGASVSQVMAMMGHTTSRMTLDLYGHLLPGSGDDLAERLEALRSASR